jgi:murein DD-endopeptidase MepM/ murein hydrolase activator NlpD
MEGPYGTETIQIVEGREGLLSPDVIQAEAERMWALWSQVTLQPYWSGSFGYPVNDVRITSAFGTRRSYNGGPANSFHAGSDFGGGIGAPIYAPAAGQVVLAESLAVRGNAVLIDHGLGLFSGYWHQSEIVAEAGQFVQPGDLIGYIGDTGLVTGPHLHWEMRLGGIAVEPLQWVVETFP